VSGHGFSRAVSPAKSIPPLGAEGFCGIGFNLRVFPVGGSPIFQSGGARLQTCAKSASTRRASAVAGAFDSVGARLYRVPGRQAASRRDLICAAASVAPAFRSGLRRNLASQITGLTADGSP